MCERNNIDRKNYELINEIGSKYPNIVLKYINSLSSKTSYTKLVYIRYVTNFLDYRDCDYKNVKPMDIDEYMEHIKYLNNGKEKSATYRNANLAALKGFYKFLQMNNIVDFNPCDLIEAPKDKSEHEIITISKRDYRIIIKNIKNGVGNEKAKNTQKKWISRDIALITLGLTTGLRISAIVGIDIDDINMKENYINVNEKGDINKKVYISDNTKDSLKRWIEDRNNMVDETERALFICQGNHRISTRSVERKFNKITQGTSKHITPHKMRATCATRLYEQTGDIYLVQQQLGHKNIENTKRYAKVSETKMREAANILDTAY